jgi:hypothetical protein
MFGATSKCYVSIPPEVRSLPNPIQQNVHTDPELSNKLKKWQHKKVLLSMEYVLHCFRLPKNRSSVNYSHLDEISKEEGHPSPLSFLNLLETSV